MLTDQVTKVALPSTSIERPALRKGQIENQNQICEGRILVIHGPRDLNEKVMVIRGPFRYGGFRSITVLFERGRNEETINLADLSVVGYLNGTWNIDNWLGNY